ISDNLPAIGVITAPVIRYVVSIQDDVLYDILKSLIRSGIAGTNIVSAYRTIVATELSIITTLHDEAGIFFPEDGVWDCNVINDPLICHIAMFVRFIWVFLLPSILPQCLDNTTVLVLTIVYYYY